MFRIKTALNCTHNDIFYSRKIRNFVAYILPTKTQNIMRRTLTFLIIAIGAISSAFAQYRFHQLSTEGSLSSSSIKCMLTDSDGFLWIGTEGGLDRYDGHSLEHFGQQLGGELAFWIIDDLQEDATGNIWIDAENNYMLYNIHTHEMIRDVAEWLRNKGIEVAEKDFKVKTDDQGALWILQNGGLTRYDLISKQKERWSDARFQMSNIKFSRSSATEHGMLICHNDGVWRFSRSTGTLQSLDIPTSKKENGNFYGAYIDSDNQFWVYSLMDNWVAHFDSRGKALHPLFRLHDGNNAESNAIRRVMDDGQGSVWIGTDHCGLYIYDKLTHEVSNVKRTKDNWMSISSDNITALAIDKQQIVWIGHFKTGVSYLSSKGEIFSSRGRQYGDVSALCHDSSQRLWIGTDGDGLYVEYPDGRSEKTSLPNIAISSIVEEKDGTVWVGTYNEGLFHVLSPKQHVQYCTANGGLKSDYAWRIFNDEHGHVWCGAAIGPLVRFDKSKGTSEIIKDEAGADILATSFCLDDHGQMLIATTYGLVGCKDGYHCQRLLAPHPLASQMLISLCFDNKKNILLVGYQKSIALFDPQNDSLYHIGNREYGRNMMVKSTMLDDMGNFWISTSEGISKLSVVRNKEDHLTYTMRNYTGKEGLYNIFFNAQSVTQTDQGEALFGGTEGITVVNTKEVDLSIRQENHLMIKNVTVDDIPVDASKGKIEVDHDKTRITVGFFNGILNNTHSIRYAYQLEGKMNDWAYTEDNHLSLVGLSPGDYRLVIKCCDEIEDNPVSCELLIHVKSPFYLSGWAFLIYILAAIMLSTWLWQRNRRRQLSKLQQQRIELEHQNLVKISEMKLKFFTNISHDLRTPLTLIISPVEMIVKQLEKGENPPMLLSQLKSIKKNAQLLLSQVGELLDFRRLDVGAESLQPSTSDLTAQIYNICLSFKGYADERGISFSWDSEEDTLMMDYDKEKMNKIMYNLLSNAFKFTPEGGSVTVDVKKVKDKACIEVADTGRGIPDAEKQKVFRRFFQSGTNDESQTGSGIGLHIVKEYVDMHGGEVSVRDNHPTGCVFLVTLPTTQETSQPAKTIEENNTKDENIRKPAEGGEQPTILVVDDNADMVSFVSSNLSEHYQVLTASNGKQALNLLQVENVNLIISDVMMPDIDGFELCRRVKSDIKTSHIPIIMLTARATDESQLEGLRLGADDYITKPFSVEVLLLRVAKLLEWTLKGHQDFKNKLEVNPSEITITPLDEQFLQKAIKIVEDQMSNSELNVEMLGEQLGMSRSFLYKKLMAVTGLGPAEFIRTIRVKRGKALLERSQLQVTEIAYMVGFNSLKSFTMNFKAEFGMTPREYQKTAEQRNKQQSSE